LDGRETAFYDGYITIPQVYNRKDASNNFSDRDQFTDSKLRDLRRSGQMMRTKIAIVCGQTVLLYSLDGQRWFSRERLA